MDIPSPPTRLERRKLQKRQQLVEAALQLLQTTTIRALNMQEVAELANFSKATLYKYFGSRQAFIDAVIANQLLAARARVQCRLEKSQSCDEAVVETMQALLVSFLFVVDGCGPECLIEPPVHQCLLDAVDLLETRLSELKVSEPQRLAAMACAWAHGLDATHGRNFVLCSHRQRSLQQGVAHEPG
tara:strand:- start:92768 stop:93325 length:558 start_codon:yes stop_codon:yes gene_type:complete